MKVLDLSKINKSMMTTLKSLNASMGFKDPSTWIHTGNYALNYRISGDFFKGFPLEGKMILLAGSSGSGKSYVASGNVVKWCQDNGVLPFIIDTENALDETWVKNFGIDPHNNIVKVSASLIDDIAKIMADFLKMYKDGYTDTPYEERQKVLFIIDSLGMAITKNDEEQFNKGDQKGNMGLKQKQIYSICRNFISSCSDQPIGLLCTQHTYVSQDMFNPDAKIAGGCLVAGTQVQLSDGSLKNIEDMEVGNFVKTILGDNEVKDTFHYQKHCFELELEDGYKIQCTDEHKFLVNVEGDLIWKQVNELSEFTDILLINKETKEMDSVLITQKTDIGVKDVYDINVENAHSYLLENGVISHNSGLEFTPSIIIAMEKRKLKEDEDGNKVSDVRGIKVSAVVRKTRYTQPFQKIDFTIPWDTGMNPYSGLFDLFSENLKGKNGYILTKSGNQYVYTNPNTGEEVFKKFRKNITNQDYDTIMMDYKLFADQQAVEEKEQALNKEVEE